MLAHFALISNVFAVSVGRTLFGGFPIEVGRIIAECTSTGLGLHLYANHAVVSVSCASFLSITIQWADVGDVCAGC